VSFLENPPFNLKVKIISIFLLPIRAQKSGETAHNFFQKIKRTVKRRPNLDSKFLADKF